MNHRPWTAKERDLVRRHYGPAAPEPLPTRELAARLGRTPKHVYNAGPRFGCLPCRAAPLRDRPAPLYALGLSDGDIADRLGCTRPAVTSWRKRHGLPSHARTPAHQRDVAARTCRLYGVACLAEMQTEQRAVAAALRGWPQARTPREADLLDALERGPADAGVLAAALGVTRSRARQLLQPLVASGLVSRRHERPFRTGGRLPVYALAPGVARHASTREKGEPGPHKAYEVRKPRGKAVGL